MFLAILMVAIMENMAIRKKLFAGQSHLELGAFGILEFLVVFTALNCCKFTHSLLIMPLIILISYSCYVSEYANVVWDPDTGEPSSDIEKNAFIANRII